jgi:hypothetical protein
MLKEWCPQCKSPFSYLFTHRQLDGTPSDYPVEESLTLLKRARWFVDELEAREKARALAAAAGGCVSARGAAAAADDGADDTDRYHAVEHDGPRECAVAGGGGGMMQRSLVLPRCLLPCPGKSG